MAVRGSGGRAATWPERARARGAAGWTPSWLLDRLGPLSGRLQDWLRIEAGPGRLVIWCPVAFGLGVILYFTADHEPAIWAGPCVVTVCAVVAFCLRARPAGFVVAVLATAAAGGFAAATLKSAYAAHPVLSRPLFGVEIAGWIEVREERERTDRITIVVQKMQAPRLDTALKRVRVSVRKGTAPPVGSFVSFKARLSPPLGPLRPGGYDFARDLYFQQLGATGFVLGKIQRLETSEEPSLRLRFVVSVAHIRDGIDARIRAALPGDTGAIASALITGKRDAISAPVNEAMYVSSLAHVLSISGYHMAVVAGVVFFVVRGLLALSAVLAIRFAIKKWAAVVALIAASAYLVLSGAEIATQRAYVMTAIVLLGVLIDRAALTLRTIAIAAFSLLLLSPESVVHPSFQMSFAATLALIAAYERGMPWAVAGADTSLGARIALWGGREIAALLLASMVAGAATTLYAAYHFHRLAPYGTLANLLAMPVVSVWVMPMGLLALVALPFGFDAFLWRLMGEGVDWMVLVALWVASLPGAVGRVSSFGVAPLLIATAGLLVMCLLRSPLRWSGALLAVLGIFIALRAPQPDILVAPGGEAVAVRTASGRLSMIKVGSDTFAMRQWLAADADMRTIGDPKLRDGFSCDESGCIARLADGTAVSIVFAPDAFQEDCRQAEVVITRRTAPPGCAAIVIDRTVWPRTGALGLIRTPSGFTLNPARVAGFDRPWARARQENASAPATSTTATPSAPDATPREEDIRPDD
jgi:competence protein ComEC